MPTEPRRPPAVAHALFARLVPPQLREEMEGDLVQGFGRVWEDRGPAAARRWAWRQLFALRPLTLRRAVRARVGDGSGALRPASGPGGVGTDMRHALRSIWARRGASLTVTATVALALGTTTAVFSVVQGVLLTPLPYAEPDRLVRVWQTKEGWRESPNHQLRAFAERFPLSVPTFNDWLDADVGFEALGAHTGARFVHQTADGAEIIHGEHVTAGVFEALDVSPYLGRSFLPEDDAVGAPRVAMLEHGFWRDRFAGRDDVVGQTITLDGAVHTIVGVMPPGFRSLSQGARIWAPLPEEDKSDERDSQFLSVVGRLAPGVPQSLAAERLASLQSRLAEQYPDSQGDLGSRMVGLLESVVGDVRSTLWFLFGAVALVLLIACANIANILSLTGLVRRRELAVKAALGASGRRLVHGLFVETVFLAGAGGALGLLLAWVALPALLRWVPATVPRYEEIGMNGGVLLFGMTLTLATALLAGILPAVQAARARPNDMLRKSGRGIAGERTGNRIRSILVVSEVALAFVLLVGAGLLGISFVKLWSVDRGFATESLLVLAADPDPNLYAEPADRDRFVDELRRLLEAIPGTSVSATNQVPLSGSVSTTSYQVERAGAEPEDANFVISVVLENYHEVMEIPLLQGRSFTRQDAEDAPLVAIANQTLAETMWPGESPIGKRMRSRDDRPWTTVVGVARDVRHAALERDAEPKLYVPVAQDHRHPDQWVLRVRGDVEGVTDLARAALATVSPTTPVRGLDLIESRIARSVAVPRFRAIFVVGLATMAGLLALLGVYGVVAFSVTQRTPEIGVRMALGASAAGVLRQVVGSGLKLAVFGIGAGLAITVLTARTVSEFLFQLEPTEPFIYLGIAVLVAVVSCAAAYLPARRAASMDPMSVLASE